MKDSKLTQVVRSTMFIIREKSCTNACHFQTILDEKFRNFPYFVQTNVDVTLKEAKTVHITLSYSESN